MDWRFLYNNGVVSHSPDVPPVSNLLESNPGISFFLFLFPHFRKNNSTKSENTVTNLRRSVHHHAHSQQRHVSPILVPPLTPPHQLRHNLILHLSTPLLQIQPHSLTSPFVALSHCSTCKRGSQCTAPYRVAQTEPRGGTCHNGSRERKWFWEERVWGVCTRGRVCACCVWWMWGLCGCGGAREGCGWGQVFGLGEVSEIMFHFVMIM